VHRSRTSFLIAIALFLGGQASASETCATDTPQPNVRRYLEKQAGRLLAPDAVDAKSLWFCGFGGLDAEAVVETVPRRLPDGSDLVRQAWCQRYGQQRPARWKCRPSEHRQTEVIVKIGDAPSRFTVVLTPDASPDLARRLVEQALAVTSQVMMRNRCAVPATEQDFQAFNADFAALPTAGNSTFTLYQSAGTWQVTRKVSSMTFRVSDGGEALLKCWAAARGEL
jgi:hypothetical protein